MSTTVTQYLLDVQPGLAVVLAATTGANTERYIHAPRAPQAGFPSVSIHAREDAGSAWHWSGQDGLGSVRQEVSSAAAVEGSRNLDAYGNLIGSVNGTIGTPYNFTGEILDGSDLLDLRARRYASTWGVFTSLDTFEGIPNRPMSLNGYLYVYGNPVNLTDANGMCAKRTTDTEASQEETVQCRQRALSLCNTYGIELTQLETLEFDNVWTTTRVGSVRDAVHAVSSKLLDNGTAFVNTLQGFEIEIRGGSLTGPDGVTRVCASTPSGTKMSLYNCNPDDPWTQNNFIHEFGHILIHRAGGILRNWESIEQKFSTDIRERIRTVADVGFFPGSRQNPYRNVDEATRLTEDVADMFLNWIRGGFPSNDEVGQRRTEFAAGLVSEFDDGTQIENIGMKGWAVQAGQSTRRSCSASAQASLQLAWLVSLTGDQCLNMPTI